MVGLPWQKLSQISPNSSIYIGGGEGRLALRLKEPQGLRHQGRRSPPPILVQLGLEGGVLLLLPTSFFSFIFDFLSLAHRALLGCPTSPPRAGEPPLGPMGFPGVGWPPPGEHREPIRHSRYIPGNARKNFGNQMKSSYISIFISGPLQKPS